MRKELESLLDEKTRRQMEEINIRVNKPVIIRLGGQGRKNEKVTKFIATNTDIREALGYISNFSMYAYEEEVREGFLTIKGGHRIGICGKTVSEGESIKTIKNINALNIRIARQIAGCADEVIMKLTKDGFDNTLIISPPCMGKTTLLREMIRLLSDRFLYKVGLVDERGEIAACHVGIPQNDIGIRTDVMDGCSKSEGIMMLVRSMAPEILAVDEIGKIKDVEAILMAGGYGGRVLGTIHGSSVEAVKDKPFMRELISEGFFKNYVVITEDRNIRVFDKDGVSDDKIYRFYSDYFGDNSDRF